MPDFEVFAPFKPTGDQPTAIAGLEASIRDNNKFQTLLGVTGSGKTFTVAELVQRVQKPTLVLAPNKTLAAQLYAEYKEFFPNNAVEYFVSYYDYYQPEAYIPRTDTYIEKESQHQRGDREAAALGHAQPLRAPRRADRRLGLLHLWPRLAGRVRRGRAHAQSRARRAGAIACCAT